MTSSWSLFILILGISNNMGSMIKKFSSILECSNSINFPKSFRLKYVYVEHVEWETTLEVNASTFSQAFCSIKQIVCQSSFPSYDLAQQCIITFLRVSKYFESS